jgi:hypothetical protein
MPCHAVFIILLSRTLFGIFWTLVNTDGLHPQVAYDRVTIVMIIGS